MLHITGKLWILGIKNKQVQKIFGRELLKWEERLIVLFRQAVYLLIHGSCDPWIQRGKLQTMASHKSIADSLK